MLLNLTGHWSIVNMGRNKLLWILFFQSFIKCTDGQRLDQEAEGFVCGKDFCSRWGYDACFKSDGKESYCLPCNQDQLHGLCGTRNEPVGCNLYCAEVLMQTMKDSLTAQLLKTRQEKEVYLTYIIALAITSSVLVAILIALVVLVVLYATKMRRSGKHSGNHDDKSSESSPFIDNSSAISSAISTSCTTDFNETKCIIKDNGPQHEATSNDHSTEDYGAKKLKGVNPSSDHEESTAKVYS